MLRGGADRAALLFLSSSALRATVLVPGLLDKLRPHHKRSPRVSVGAGLGLGPSSLQLLAPKQTLGCKAGKSLRVCVENSAAETMPKQPSGTPRKDGQSHLGG